MRVIGASRADDCARSAHKMRRVRLFDQASDALAVFAAGTLGKVVITTA
jgi:uncharacterized membrane protein